jgi:hypothetical protein
MAGVPRAEAAEAMRLASHKLPSTSSSSCVRAPSTPAGRPTDGYQGSTRPQ